MEVALKYKNIELSFLLTCIVVFWGPKIISHRSNRKHCKAFYIEVQIDYLFQSSRLYNSWATIWESLKNFFFNWKCDRF